MCIHRLAHRLGIWELKWQLDDLAFRHLDEAKYREISRILAARRSQREAYVAEVSNRLREELEGNRLNAEVIGRPKGIYSIHRKMQKYEAEGKELSDIYDLYAMRVIVDDVADCYAALGVTHRMWSPIPGQFDDYIATPKQNMYQALHTTVHCDGGHPLEVQIKTKDMHQVAEYGVAAHWRYKERAGSAAGGRFEERMTWLRQLLEWQRETPDTDEFLQSVREDLFHDQVFVYTPKGDIMELATGATPIDFAYKIHTDLGHRISGAKVNGRLVSLDTPLENGDTVEVVAGKTGRGPSPDWLNPARGYVATNSARQKIRSWFNRQARSANITRGKDLLRRELHRMGVKLSDREVLELCRFETMEDLLAALGSGELSDAALSDRLAEHRSKEAEAAAWMPPLKGPQRLDSPTSGISVLGVGDLLTRIATCCNPIQGDAIIGFVTRSRGVSVHKVECKNVLNEDEKERLVPVSWGQKQELYPVRVRIEAIDRVGLLRDVSTKLSEDKINIAWVVTRENDNATVSMELTIHIAGLQQLNRVFSRIESVRGVTSVSRVTGSPAPASGAVKSSAPPGPAALSRAVFTPTAAKLLVAVAVFLAILLMPTPEGLTLQGQRALAVMTFVVILWATEVVHSSVAGIIGVVLLVLFGAVSGIGEAVYGFSQPVCYFLIGILTLGLAVHHSGLAERMATFLMRGATGRPSLLYVQMLFSFAALTFALPSASTSGSDHGARVRAGAGAVGHTPRSSLLQSDDDGDGRTEPPGLHGPAGRRHNSGGGVGSAGRFLVDAVVRHDERTVLRQPRRGRHDAVPVLPFGVSPGGNQQCYSGAAGTDQARRDTRRRHRHAHCADVVHRLRPRSASVGPGADSPVPDPVAASGHPDVGRIRAQRGLDELFRDRDVAVASPRPGLPPGAAAWFSETLVGGVSQLAHAAFAGAAGTERVLRGGADADAQHRRATWRW